MKTFRQLQDEVLRFFDLAEEPDSAADRVLVQNTLNQANQRRATEDRWKFMLSSRFTLTVEAGTAEYILPHNDLDKLQYLWSVTNHRFIHTVPMKEIPYADVNFAQSIDSDNLYYEIDPKGSPVAVQPTGPDKLVLTSSATEASDVRLYVEGEDEDGQPISESLIPDGAHSTLEYAKITYYAKVGDWAGTLTLVNEGGDELLTLTVDEFGKEYAVLRFYNTPTLGETFQYRYFRQPRTMSRDFDRPDLPFPVSNILVYDALLDLATYHELDSESVNIWRDQQEKWQTTLYMQKLEADTVAGMGLSITNMGDF